MKKRVDIDKASIYSIVINAVQIVAVVGMALLVVLTDLAARSLLFVEFIICLAAALVSWGAVVDITQALSARRVSEQSQMLEEAYRRMEALNTSLRAQRHDFMNHWQVVGSLVEMHEYEAAEEYIDRVYGAIQAVSAALRTANPAVNALMQAKQTEAQQRGVYMELSAQSRWENLPMQGWEMCRVLGNLIDNGLDALKDTQAPRMTITLSETDHEFRFVVENNGPEVPETIRANIFLPGYTTKGGERGMGLYIVRSLLQAAKGDIALESNNERTRFVGVLPKTHP
ncbi:MAG: Spo0B domain-containing protein [Oscillospiraceae bacterium]|jgi:sensor histidine kinase regulating citrate/malate metabolism|nr:Spo0B domain-containing protein [Oscillospiraceae bacterium]